MSAQELQFARKAGLSRRGRTGLAGMALLAALWLAAVSHVHVNASWSDEAWGDAAFPLFGEDPNIGDRVLFELPEAVGSRVPYLKTVRGMPGMAIAVGQDRTVFLDVVKRQHLTPYHPIESTRCGGRSASNVGAEQHKLSRAASAASAGATS